MTDRLHNPGVMGMERRKMLRLAAGMTAGLMIRRACAADSSTVIFPFANGKREIAPAGMFAEKGAMVLQRTRAPLLETPWEVLSRHVFTPNDRFYVRWHFANFPNHIDISPDKFRLRISGKVNRPFEISVFDLVRDFAPIEIAAVNQCSGNSRGFVVPRVPGAQWGHGAMGNARWTGVRLRDLLARAGLKPTATHVALRSLEDKESPFPPPLHFEKVLQLDHANDGEVMVAYAMNGEPLPLLNGYPLRLVVPGWYATYWVKMLSDIEVLDHPGTGYWMATAYKVPDRPNGAMRPGETNVPMVAISSMTPRSFFTAPSQGAEIPYGRPTPIQGFAFGGGSGLRFVDISTDNGQTWRPAELGEDYGTYSFRTWRFLFTPQTRGPCRLLVRATNTKGEQQPLSINWNPGGYMYNPVEELTLLVV